MELPVVLRVIRINTRLIEKEKKKTKKKESTGNEALISVLKSYSFFHYLNATVGFLLLLFYYYYYVGVDYSEGLRSEDPFLNRGKGHMLSDFCFANIHH